MANDNKVGKILIVIIVIVSVIGVVFLEPIKQDLNYHQFIDQKTHLGLPHFWNVMSNIPFFIVGIYGLISIKKMNIVSEITAAYWAFFFGVAMVALGSGYYHFIPKNNTLVWDRLPMTIAFMSLFSIIISEHVNKKLGFQLLLPFICLGVFSVFYWQWTESQGAGDLRMYVLVQFVPIILIPIILIFFKSQYNSNLGYWLILILYVLAKIFEYFDATIYHISGDLISGHSIKHIAAAFGILLLLNHYKNRIKV